MRSVSSKSNQIDDIALEKVIAEIKTIPAFAEKAADVIRDAIDEVLRGGKTGRYSIEQLTRQEKAHIGTQVEIALIQIPREAVGELCLLVQINEQDRMFSIGLIRASEAFLNRPNQDLKKTLSTIGKSNIYWIVNKGVLPISIFLQISPETRERIWSHKSGQKRIRELFRLVQKIPILRSDIVALAKQDDPTKRARDAKKYLRNEGILVVCGRYSKESEQARVRGHELKSYEWMSFPG